MYFARLCMYFAHVHNMRIVTYMVLCLCLIQVTPEAKKRAAEAKLRGGDAFSRKDYQAAVDAYTQVHYISFSVFSV